MAKDVSDRKFVRHFTTDCDGHVLIGGAVENLPTEDANFEILFRQLIGAINEPLWWDKLLNRLRLEFFKGQIVNLIDEKV